MNAIFQGGLDVGLINKDVCIQEINELIAWQEERKKWHQDKTRQKMAAEGTGENGGGGGLVGAGGFKSSDFGLNEVSGFKESVLNHESCVLTA
jgi:hypothetical protein